MNLRTPAAALALFVSAIASAQDLTWSELDWVSPDDAPDTLPVAKRLRVPDLPEAMAKVPEPGYVELRMWISPKGERQTIAMGASSPWLTRDDLNPFFQATFEAAKREGKRVDSEVRLHLLYNPATASPKRADATPRLLGVMPPTYPRLRKGEKPATVVLPMTVELDASGQVTGATAPEGSDRRFAREAAFRTGL